VKYEIKIGSKTYLVEFDDSKKANEINKVFLNGKEIAVDTDKKLSSFLINDRSFQLKSYVIVDGKPARLSIDDTQLNIIFKDKKHRGSSNKNSEGIIKSPLQGIVSGISISKGDKVNEKQVLITIEAMKMQNEIRAPFSGTIKTIKAHEGDNIKEGDFLIEISPDE